MEKIKKEIDDKPALEESKGAKKYQQLLEKEVEKHRLAEEKLKSDIAKEKEEVQQKAIQDLQEKHESNLKLIQVREEKKDQEKLRYEEFVKRNDDQVRSECVIMQK